MDKENRLNMHSNSSLGYLKYYYISIEEKRDEEGGG